jgi:hypothetical protein
MKNIKSNCSITALITILLIAVSCERKLDGLELATYPTTPEVFIDGFSAGLYYAAYGTSKVTAFKVDYAVKYKGTASMRFDVPDNGDPNGSYVGGVYGTNPGRDLSGYNVLTFWAKATQPATLNEVGFGNDLGESKYKVMLTNVALNSNWMKFYVPFPDPSVLKQERGMFYYSAAPINGKGYTIWIDEVQFENMGTIAHTVYKINNGNDLITSGPKGTYSITDFKATFNLPTGVDQTEAISSLYYTFTSSDESIATVDSTGVVTLIGNGTAKITAKVGNIDAIGSLTITTSGPTSAAPVPTHAAANVISVYSNSYTNITIDDYCEHWEWGQGQSWHQIITTEYSFSSMNGNDFIHYSNYNDVWGLKRVIAPIKFKSNPQNVSTMTHVHIDVWVPSTSTYTTNKPTIALQDLAGAQVGVTRATSLPLDQWVSLEIALSSYSGIDKTKLTYYVLDNFPSDIYVDNLYFHK